MHKLYKYTGLTFTIGAALCAGVFVGALNLKPIALVMSNLGCPVLTIAAVCTTTMAAVLGIVSAVQKNHEGIGLLGAITAHVIGLGATMLCGTAFIELSASSIVSANSVRSIIQCSGALGLGLAVLGVLMYHYSDAFSPGV